MSCRHFEKFEFFFESNRKPLEDVIEESHNLRFNQTFLAAVLRIDFWGQECGEGDELAGSRHY